MQTLFACTQEDFLKQIYRISSQNLVKLLYEIYELKHDRGQFWDESTMMDIERKETKINAELIRRGYLDKKGYEEYFRMMRKLGNGKKKVFTHGVPVIGKTE